MATQAIHLDGTTLEGGGQLLRIALGLASLARLPIHVTNMRGNRAAKGKSGKGGGLKAAHLAAAQWLARATDATTEGLEIGSKDLAFSPTPQESRPMMREEVEVYEEVWDNVYENGRLCRKQTTLSMSSPGAVTLILQAILPYLIFNGSLVPLWVTIQGGTNVSRSPSIDYVIHVFLPTLHSKLGLPPIETIVHKRGWSSGRTEIGSVTFKIQPRPSTGQTLQAFSMDDRGIPKRIFIKLMAPDLMYRKMIQSRVLEQMQNLLPGIVIDFTIDESSGHSQRLYLLVTVETTTDCRLAADYLCELKSPKKVAKKGKDANTEMKEKVEHVVSKVVAKLGDELKHGGCVDEYMQDQLVIFQALLEGRSTINTGQLSATLHTQTARWVAERIMGVHFDKDGNCEGVGL